MAQGFKYGVASEDLLLLLILIPFCFHLFNRHKKCRISDIQSKVALS